MTWLEFFQPIVLAFIGWACLVGICDTIKHCLDAKIIENLAEEDTGSRGRIEAENQARRN